MKVVRYIPNLLKQLYDAFVRNELWHNQLIVSDFSFIDVNACVKDLRAPAEAKIFDK